MRDWNQKYTLDDNNNVVPCDLMTWGRYMWELRRRIVKQERVPEPDGLFVSTVFLGIDHNFDLGDPEPHLFETMIFRDGGEVYMERCSTWSQALVMHDRAVDWAIKHPDGDDD